MAANEVAIVVGAGQGLGAALCRRFVKAGMLVAAATRDKDRVTAVAKEAGARGYGCDAGDETSVLELFAAVKRDFGEPSVVIYNAGAYLPKTVIDTSAEEFEHCWRIGCFGGFLVGREAARAMVPKGRGTILFTGATASLRGSANFVNLAVGKFGLRALAQSLAKAYARDGVHVVHVRLDCDLDVPIVRRLMGAKFDGEHAASTDDVAQTYLWVCEQPRSAWSNEVELRPFTENWTI
jgi:NAD(P)-dependent dehydrogenase (short-subunit alcohol dehydrogenase family)